MFRIARQAKSGSAISAKSLRAAGLASCQHSAEVNRSKLIRNLQSMLGSWIPSKDVLERFPFFTDINEFVNRYSQCIQVEVDNAENAVSLKLNKELLKKFNLPDNIMSILEYGTSVTPPFPHIRRLQMELAR